MAFTQFPIPTTPLALTINGVPIIGGADKAVLIDQGGFIGADPNFSWDYTNKILSINGGANVPIVLSRDQRSGGGTYNALDFGSGTANDANAAFLGFVAGGPGDPNLYLEIPGTGGYFFGTNSGAPSTPGLFAGISVKSFSLYNAFTNNTNFESGGLDWLTSNVLSIGTRAGSGGGTARNLQFIKGTNVILDFGVTHADEWTFGGDAGYSLIHVGYGLAQGASNSGFYVSLGNTPATQRISLALDPSNNSQPVLSFSASDVAFPGDTILNRQSAGVFGIGTSTTNTSGTLSLASVIASAHYAFAAGTAVLGAQGGSPNYTNIFPPASTSTGALIQVGDASDPTVYAEADAGFTVNNRAATINYGFIDATGVTSMAFNANAGTASVAPINLTAGTNLTTATAGAVEFDGKSFYATAVASSRQVVDAEQVQVLSGTYTLANNTNAQPLFNATAAGAITLAGSTTYEFELCFAVSGLSTSSHTISLGFGGGASLTSIAYFLTGFSATGAATPAAATTQYVEVATATALTGAQTTNNFNAFYVRGIVRISGGGTFIPQITQNTNSAAAIVQANAFFRCWPVGSNTVTNVGDWS